MLDSVSSEVRQPGPPRTLNQLQVYPKAVSGVIRQTKWAILVVCLTIYYVVPWIR